ncbi:MAG: nucleotidyltransferase domain-containing protein [Chitinophagaceae bacterium]
MSNAEKSIIGALAYFNAFNYPLKKEEIYNFLDTVCDRNLFEQSLEFLCKTEIVYKLDEFYSLQQHNQLAERRMLGNQKAAQQLRIAVKIAKLLYAFPFVRGIAVSGSLSKGYADEHSDIDFFIITKGNRLWLARTLLHLFKKLMFLAGKQHWFCMNYFIDEMALEIKEKNIFTAVEVATVIPLCGVSAFRDFFDANKWVKNFCPQHLRWNEISPEAKNFTIQPVYRKKRQHSVTGKLNEWLMRTTERRWKRKAERGIRSYSGELMGLDADIHYAKPDPSNLQRKILYRYEKQLDTLFTGLESLKAV